MSNIKCPECGFDGFTNKDIDDIIAECPECGLMFGVPYGY